MADSNVKPSSYRSIPPSSFVRMARVYLAWCSVSICEECGMVAKYEDMHPVDPCPFCGSAVNVAVGRWEPAANHWWEFWKYGKGKWILHPNNR